jgi:hypothetical protein
MKINELSAVRYSQLEAFRASGKKAEEWCKENDIRISTLRYWITKTNRKDKQSQQGFIAFTPSACKPSVLVVKIGSYKIEVAPGFDAATFKETVLLLQSL